MPAVGQLDTFGDLKTQVARRMGVARPADIEVIGTYVLRALRDVWRRFQWPERHQNGWLKTFATIDTLLLDAVADGDTTVDIPGISAEVSAADLPVNLSLTLEGAFYTITSLTGETATLDRPWGQGDQASGTACVIWSDLVKVPDDWAEILDGEVHLFDDNGHELGSMLKSEARSRMTTPKSIGRPEWWCPASRYVKQDGTLERRLRVGQDASERSYEIFVGYLSEYPDPGDEPDAKPILIPVDRRELAEYRALQIAYGEEPFQDTGQMDRFRQLYEEELHRAIESEREHVAETFYLETWDDQYGYHGTTSMYVVYSV